MPAARRERGAGPYEAEVVRRVAERAPLVFNLLLVCLVLDLLHESPHFPERRRRMAIFAAGFLLLVAVARALVGRRPAWSVYVLLGFVNMRGRNDRRRLLAAGFQAHVVKPFDPAQLAATIGNTAPELPA